MDPVEVLLEAIAERLRGRSTAILQTASKYPASSPADLSPDDLKKLARELKDVTAGFEDLKKAQKVLTEDQVTAQRQQKQAQQQANKNADAANRKSREAEVTMGRLPLASIPAMLHGNISAGARVGYALGEKSPVGRWGGLGLGAGVAGAIGTGFAASPMGTDIIYQPFKILAGTIGADVLPALHRFGAMLLDIADWWSKNRGVTTGAITAIGVGATALGGAAALRGLSGLLGIGGAGAAGAAGASGTIGFMNRVAAPATLLKGLVKGSAIGGAILEGPDMIAGLGGGGSNEGRGGLNSVLRYAVSGLGGILGGMLGGPAGAVAGATGLWSLTGGASSGFGSGAGRKPTENEMMLFQENLHRIGGRAGMGTDLTQIQKDVQMASFESPMELRQRQVYMEGVEKIIKAIKGE